MKIRINGEKIIRNAEVIMSGDGRTMTIKAVNPDGGVVGVSALLSGEPKIEVMDSVGTEVKAVYQGAKATAVSMQLSGGVPVVTVTLLVSKINAGELDKLREQINSLGDVIEDQALVIGAQAERITAQEETIKAMAEAVTQAHSAAQTAYDAIKEIEEGIADA